MLLARTGVASAAKIQCATRHGQATRNRDRDRSSKSVLPRCNLAQAAKYRSIVTRFSGDIKLLVVYFLSAAAVERGWRTLKSTKSRRWTGQNLLIERWDCFYVQAPSQAHILYEDRLPIRRWLSGGRREHERCRVCHANDANIGQTRQIPHHFKFIDWRPIRHPPIVSREEEAFDGRFGSGFGGGMQLDVADETPALERCTLQIAVTVVAGHEIRADEWVSAKPGFECRGARNPVRG